MIDKYVDKLFVLFVILVIFGLMVAYQVNDKMIALLSVCLTGQLSSLSTLLSSHSNSSSKEEDKKI